MRLIAINRTLRAEAERLLPVLEAAKAPASEEETLAILVRHAPHYGITAKVAGEWGAFFGSYLDALSGLSAYMIEDAFVRWNRGEGGDIRTSGFYPKSGQLYLLATAARTELSMAVYRAKRAMEYVEKQAPRKISEEERKRVAAEFAQLAQSMGRGHGMPTEPRPRFTPQQVAQQLRAAAPVARADDVGDVI